LSCDGPIMVEKNLNYFHIPWHVMVYVVNKEYTFVVIFLIISSTHFRTLSHSLIHPYVTLACYVSQRLKS
jgi:hypothetical protein